MITNTINSIGLGLGVTSIIESNRESNQKLQTIHKNHARDMKKIEKDFEKKNKELDKYFDEKQKLIDAGEAKMKEEIKNNDPKAALEILNKMADLVTSLDDCPVQFNICF